MPYLLDTCAILFIAENTTDLSPATVKLIDAAPAGEVFVSAISVAELACLARLYHNAADPLAEAALSGDEQRRLGACEVAKSNLLHPECRAWCEPVLLGLNTERMLVRIGDPHARRGPELRTGFLLGCRYSHVIESHRIPSWLPNTEIKAIQPCWSAPPRSTRPGLAGFASRGRRRSTARGFREWPG